MKKLIICAVSILVLLGAAPLTATAGDGAAAGTLIGAGSGALIGRAVGQNTDSMLVGGVIGGMVGLLIGSDYDRADHRVVYAPPGYRARPRYEVWNSATVIVVVDGRRRPVHVKSYRSGRDWILWGDFYGRGNQRLIIENRQYPPREIFIGNRDHGRRDHWQRGRFAGHRSPGRHGDRDFDHRGGHNRRH